jgi:hypothetical protein
MRTLLSAILVGVSLALGTLAAVTAYLPRLDAAAAAIAAGETITLNAESGMAAGGPDDKPAAIAKSGDALAPELVERLRAAGVERVRVREISFSRWTHRWLFLASVAGLVAGGLGLRSGRSEAGLTGGSANAPSTPAVVFASLRTAIDALDADMPALRQSADGCDQAVARLGEMQGGPIDTFAGARDALVARYGMGGFAAIMSRFAVMERQINRAWSAAADGAFDESAACVRRARELAPGVTGLLGTAGVSRPG